MDNIPFSNWDPAGKPWIDPVRELEYHRKLNPGQPTEIPEWCIICYQRYQLENLKKVFGAEPVFNVAGIPFHECEIGGTRVGVIKSGVGAALTGLVLEQIIVRGVKRVLNIGTAGCYAAGGMAAGDLVLCTKSMRNEGTSFHYQEPSRFAYPDESLLADWERVLIASDIPFHKGPGVTIDAPYQMPIAKALELRQEGMITQDMEASAVFSICRFRGVQCAALFTLSDLATEDFQWVPHFRTDALKKGHDRLTEACRAIIASRQSGINGSPQLGS